MAIFLRGWPSWAGGLSDKELRRLICPRWSNSAGVLSRGELGGEYRGKGLEKKGEDTRRGDFIFKISNFRLQISEIRLQGAEIRFMSAGLGVEISSLSIVE